MKKTKALLILPVFLGLLLAGCGGDSSQTSGGGDTTSQGGGGGGTTSQGGGSGSGDVNNFWQDNDYTEHQGWPTAIVSAFLSRNSITDGVPELPDVGKVFYATSDNPDFYDFVALAIPGRDRLNEYVNKLNGANYKTKQIEKAYTGVSKSEKLGITLGYLKNYAGAPDSLYIYIVPNTPDTFGLHNFEKTTGWPGAIVNQYLTGAGVAETLPALPNVATSYYAVKETSEGDFLMIFIPGDDRSVEYGDILVAAAYTSYGDMFMNDEMTIAVMLQALDVADFSLIEGMMIMVMASAGGGE